MFSRQELNRPPLPHTVLPMIAKLCRDVQPKHKHGVGIPFVSNPQTFLPNPILPEIQPSRYFPKDASWA